jgi:hypothetical protein
MKITSYNHHLRLLVSPASLFLNNQRLTPGSLGAFVLIQSIQARFRLEWGFSLNDEVLPLRQPAAKRRKNAAHGEGCAFRPSPWVTSNKDEKPQKGRRNPTPMRVSHAFAKSLAGL